MTMASAQFLLRAWPIQRAHYAGQQSSARPIRRSSCVASIARNRRLWARIMVAAHRRLSSLPTAATRSCDAKDPCPDPLYCGDAVSRRTARGRGSNRLACVSVGFSVRMSTRVFGRLMRDSRCL